MLHRFGLGRLWAVDYGKPPGTSGHQGIESPQVITRYVLSREARLLP